ncbi:hypothetical protein [Paenibacillus piri]|uniref:ParB/Sulfiredoxin domain-containing protein n=1 Tax=Paenibacillus piri TaxID=2547395 RepID=A0A4R5KQP3_9BACL|nr:hypothetical protein [Paenibacillus piri]TDF98083.1 hypothetical protein E1757_11280 [Paenibacillus piri]
MRFTVQYIPLSRIKPGLSSIMTAKLRKLRSLVWDCMHVLVVRKNRKDGTYTVLLGQDRYDFLTKHTKKLTAPCLVDESKTCARLESWLHRLRNERRRAAVPFKRLDRLTPPAWSIIRTFMNTELARFNRLTCKQQIQVLILAVRYKRTVVALMKSKVDQLSSRPEPNSAPKT